jgi:hypothetical protein
MDIDMHPLLIEEKLARLAVFEARAEEDTIPDGEADRADGEGRRELFARMQRTRDAKAAHQRILGKIVQSWEDIMFSGS